MLRSRWWWWWWWLARSSAVCVCACRYTSVGETTCNNRGEGPAGVHSWPRHGSFGHYKEDTETFATWKVDYVKVLIVDARTMTRTSAHAAVWPMPCTAARCTRRLTRACKQVDWCGGKEGHSAEELHSNFSHCATIRRT
eukprot:COSAG01_NODE_868_length_13035_cov_4.786024_14_plen_139_part_00